MTEHNAKDINFVSFPDVSNCNEDGLLGMGGDLNLNTLVSAYSQGIFPWFNEDQPILWWSPDPRMVLFPSEVKISRSLRKTINKKVFKITCNTAFERVINACALRGAIPKKQHPESANFYETNTIEQASFEQAGFEQAMEDTWITSDMQSAYIQLHQKGYAHSIEVWQDEQLVGGLYGVCLGKVFFGESMFSRTSDASKVAFVALAQSLHRRGFSVIDCQVSSNHLISLGAREISRNDFLKHLTNIDIHQANVNFSDGIAQASSNNDINAL